MSLTTKEKNYIEAFKEGKIDYDLNYRLKKKFLKLHEDYWSLVAFFKTYQEKVEKYTTDQTKESINIALSQIPSSEILNSAKCLFCKGTNKKMVEITLCEECKSAFGI